MYPLVNARWDGKPTAKYVDQAVSDQQQTGFLFCSAVKLLPSSFADDFGETTGFYKCLKCWEKTPIQTTHESAKHRHSLSKAIPHIRIFVIFFMHLLTCDKIVNFNGTPTTRINTQSFDCLQTDPPTAFVAERALSSAEIRSKNRSKRSGDALDELLYFRALSITGVNRTNRTQINTNIITSYRHIYYMSKLANKVMIHFFVESARRVLRHIFSIGRMLLPVSRALAGTNLKIREWWNIPEWGWGSLALTFANIQLIRQAAPRACTFRLLAGSGRLVTLSSWLRYRKEDRNDVRRKTNRKSTIRQSAVKGDPWRPAPVTNISKVGDSAFRGSASFTIDRRQDTI